jgi:hypothetical protein
MTSPRFIAKPDELDRRVLFAVELIDPITQLPVWRGITVTAVGIQAKPIINRSGRLVWLVEGDAWPGDITVDPGDQPYLAHTQGGPPRPPDILNARPDERLVRIILRPTVAYPFDSGATVVRGSLKDRDDVPNSPAIPGAIVQLAWQDDSPMPAWHPGPPQPGELWPRTGLNGEFAAVLQLVDPASQHPKVENGRIKARVQVTVGFETRATPDTFPFLPNANPGFVPEGQLLLRDVTLGWMQLVAI